MAFVPNLAAGTASIFWWMIFRARPHDCGSQILLRDPSGNLVELFQPARRQ
jgi:hypothetical protein